MIYQGQVKGGVIVLDMPTLLPEGAVVRVELVEDEAIDPLFRMTELAVDAGAPDLGLNIDHYLYGHPKVDDDE